MAKVKTEVILEEDEKAAWDKVMSILDEVIDEIPEDNAIIEDARKLWCTMNSFENWWIKVNS